LFTPLTPSHTPPPPPSSSPSRFLSQHPPHHRALHSFPTRRSSDLATALMLGLLPQARRAALSVGLSALVVAALAFAILLPSGAPEVQVVGQRLGAFSAPFSSNPYDARPAIWRQALRESQAHPWTGVGPDNFLEASSR